MSEEERTHGWQSPAGSGRHGAQKRVPQVEGRMVADHNVSKIVRNRLDEVTKTFNTVIEQSKYVIVCAADVEKRYVIVCAADVEKRWKEFP